MVSLSGEQPHLDPETTTLFSKQLERISGPDSSGSPSSPTRTVGQLLSGPPGTAVRPVEEPGPSLTQTNTDARVIAFLIAYEL